MGKWTSESKTRVASMSGGDFFSNEVSATLPKAATAKIVLETASGETVLKDGVSYPAGTVVDATYMSAAALDAFLAEVSDPNIVYELMKKLDKVGIYQRREVEAFVEKRQTGTTFES